MAEREAASGAPNAATSSDATQGAHAANTAMEGGASPAPDTPTSPDATQGAHAANTATEGGASPAPNAPTTVDATQSTDAANTTTEGGGAGAPNAATASGAPTSTGTGDDPDVTFKNLAASWERKKAAAEAAGTDTTKALIGTAMHSRKEAESEMQVLRQCELYTH
jgi:hypothetical protein